MKFPDDPNGDALRRMEAAGDDLTRTRDIEFTVVFPDESTAKQFADYVCTQGYPASAALTETVDGFPWDVVIVKHSAPSYEEIGAFEEWLQQAADPFGGRNDGWGCLSSSPDTLPQ